MLLRQVYVKPSFILATTFDNRFSPLYVNRSHSYLVTHDSSMYADHNIGKTRRPCVPYTREDFMLNEESIMGVEGNYTTPGGERSGVVGGQFQRGVVGGAVPAQSTALPQPYIL